MTTFVLAALLALMTVAEVHGDVPTDQRRPSVKVRCAKYHGGALDSARRRVTFFASRLGVPPPLALAVTQHESAWNPLAVSSKGAIGLMQVMPGTAIQYGFDPDQLDRFDYGAYVGLRILRDLLDRFHNYEPVALAAYYAGPDFWRRNYSLTMQKEIERYVARVLELGNVYSYRLRCR